MLRKILEQILLTAILRHMEEREVIWNNQCGFVKGRSCLANLVALCCGITVSLDNRRDTDVICLNFSKAFDMVSLALLLLSKLERYGFDGRSVSWKKN